MALPDDAQEDNLWDMSLYSLEIEKNGAQGQGKESNKKQPLVKKWDFISSLYSPMSYRADCPTFGGMDASYGQLIPANCC